LEITEFETSKQTMTAQKKGAPETLPESASLLLDFVRLTAALLVVIAHFTHPEFGLGYWNRQYLGDIAVPVFFVLSGFVIRYVTRTRESTAREYFIDRASRIYSVVLPAMVFTLAVSGVCFLIDRHLFLRDWADTFNHPIVRIVANLTFVSQAWGRNTIPFINSPFWSLGYECIYYLAYGFLFFFRGWKRILGCAILLVGIGPQVLFLFPVWWVGCWMYELYQRWRGGRLAAGLQVVAGGWLVVGGALYLLGQRFLLRAPLVLFHKIADLPNPLVLMGLAGLRANMFAVAVGVFSSAALLVLLLAMDHIEISRSSRWARWFRSLANGTFTIYLMHYPFLVLLLFLGLLRPYHDLFNVLVTAGMCAVLIAIAVPVDAFKLVIRRWLRTLGSERMRMDEAAQRMRMR
jgi:peptidoglycan/LPS O-acetylase OafA/YrhL